MSKFLRSMSFAWDGIRRTVQTQRNMRIHAVAAVIVNAAGLLLGLTRMEWVSILIVQGLVLAAELVNTAVEHIVDLTSPERNALAKSAKDAAAGAVLMTAIMAAIVGLIVFGPYVLH
ncbi:diacylglycerol kinase family protein [Paenibacillus sp. R14(2021)]|uniref:diacylglycerol kinase family protein n=1 Tax=Paenibacillus sp. R14(2021) TaxID=2859228 RepID=UPI001C6136F0|nr:diacylglycerol kinase family protein [Paenibacillus sp. R14(2021)]